jgi:hypothetical protein
LEQLGFAEMSQVPVPAETRGIPIGPRGDDPLRERRSRTVGNIWRGLHADANLHHDFGIAVDFFRESLSCYQNGAFMATALMCRASTETAVYLALARRRTKLQIRLNLGSIHDNWLSILSKARKRKFVDVETERMLRHIRRKGDFVAHYGQKFDQKIRQEQGLGSLWITRVEAEEVLRQTVKVLNHLGEEKLNQGIKPAHTC